MHSNYVGPKIHWSFVIISHPSYLYFKNVHFVPYYNTHRKMEGEKPC
jgi:hypothetical protein